MKPYSEQTYWKKEREEPWYGDKEILVALITGAISSTISIVNLYFALNPPV